MSFRVWSGATWWAVCLSPAGLGYILGRVVAAYRGRRFGTSTQPVAGITAIGWLDLVQMLLYVAGGLSENTAQTDDVRRTLMPGAAPSGMTTGRDES